MTENVAGLAAVVYGRTLYVDEWWRAVPAGMPVSGWLNDTVHAAFASAVALDEGPRFLLARTASYRLVGVACRAAELSEEFNADPRPLSCFVGWLSDSAVTASGRPARLPGLRELRAHYTQWAGSDYDRYIRDSWKADREVAARPVLSVPAPVPWPAEPGGPGGQDSDWYFTSDAAEEAFAPLTPLPGHATLCPEREQDRLWASGLVTSGAFTLVTGWSRAGDAELVDLGFICAADVTQRRDRAVTVLVPGFEPKAEPPQGPHREQSGREQAGSRRQEAGSARQVPRGAPAASANPGFGRKCKKIAARALRTFADLLDEDGRENEIAARPVPRTGAGRSATVFDLDGRPAADSDEGQRRAKRTFGSFDT